MACYTTLMLDQLMSVRNKHRYALTSTGYTPEQSVEHVAYTANGNQKLAALFSPWHRAERYYQTLAGKLADQGYDVVTYTLSPHVLGTDAAQVVASYRCAAETIAYDLQERYTAGTYRYLHLIGTSIGNLPAVMLTSRLPLVNEITLAAVASDLARCCWEGIRTRDLRDIYERAGISEEQLVKLWHQLAPLHYIPYMADKKINLVVALKDRVIPTKYQLEFRDALAAANVPLTVRHYNAGHYASILRYCLTARV